MDYYEVMGLARDADADDIKRAYRRLARKYHPDVSKEADAEARFKEIGEAYKVLKDPETRKLYDQYGADWQRAGTGGGPQSSPGPGSGDSKGFRGFADEADYRAAFEEIFGGNSERGSWRFASRGEDYEARLPITLERAYAGGRDTLAFDVATPGPDGRIQRASKTLSVTIPKGVLAGQRLRLSGQGAAGRGEGEAGDLFAVIEFIPHPHFRADGADIHLDLPVSVTEAALGASVTVPTLGGAVQLTIPRGAKSDQKLRLRGRGLPAKSAGDQIVTLKIVVTSADSPERTELYERLRELETGNPRASLGV